MNVVILTGRLTKDPDLRYLPNGGPAVANFTMAVDREYKKDGQPTADFINCVIWRKAAENLKQYFSKGQKINIVGKIQVRKWQTNEGDNRYTTEVLVDRWEFGESKKGNGGGGGNQYNEDDAPPDYGDDDAGSEEDGDEIPF